MSAQRDEMRMAVDREDWDEVRRMLTQSSGSLRVLLSGLHHPDKTALARVLHGFRIAAQVLAPERLLDLLRRLMWLLNEESGNNCPAAALAIAEIATVAPDAVAPHLPVLRVYANDPSSRMRDCITQALARIDAITPTSASEAADA